MILTATFRINFSIKIYDKKNEVRTKFKTQKTKSKRWITELQKTQTSIADVETINLFWKYSAEAYEKIINYLDAKFDKRKDEIEQTRLRIKQLGKEQKWLDWVQKYTDQVDELDTYSDEQKKEYVYGIIDRIEVRLDQESKDHHLDTVFRLPYWAMELSM